VIVVKIELHSARTGRVEEIGKMFIINDGSGTLRRRHYAVRVMRRRSSCLVQRNATVRNHASLSTSVWTLVRKALQAAGL
jgi:hypothetical protein